MCVYTVGLGLDFKVCSKINVVMLNFFTIQHLTPAQYYCPHHCCCHRHNDNDDDHQHHRQFYLVCQLSKYLCISLNGHECHMKFIVRIRSGMYVGTY